MKKRQEREYSELILYTSTLDCSCVYHRPGSIAVASKSKSLR